MRHFFIVMTLLGLWTLILTSPNARSQEQSSTAIAESKTHDVRGRLEVIEGQQVLFLWGSSKERGFAEGYLMAQVILTTFDEYCLSPQMMPKPELWNLMALPLVKSRVEISDRLRERAEGIAQGIQAALGEEGKSKKLKRPLTAEDFIGIAALIDWIGQFCSSYVAHGDMLDDLDGPLVGRNLDYPGSPTMTRHTLVKVEAPDEEARTHGWISFGWAGMLGCVTGFSEAGVTVAIHDVPAAAPEGKVRPRVDTLAHLIETLEPSASIAEEARLQTQQSNYAMGGNFMIGWGGDEFQGGAVLEVHPLAKEEGGVQVRESGETFVICTNHHRAGHPEASCHRYDKLCQVCESVEVTQESPLDFETGWSLIQKTSVKFTLYRLLVDIGSGSIRFQHRLTPFGEWAGARNLQAKTLFENCREWSSSAR